MSSVAAAYMVASEQKRQHPQRATAATATPSASSSPKSSTDSARSDESAPAAKKSRSSLKKAALKLVHAVKEYQPSPNIVYKVHYGSSYFKSPQKVEERP